MTTETIFNFSPTREEYAKNSGNALQAIGYLIFTIIINFFFAKYLNFLGQIYKIENIEQQTMIDGKGNVACSAYDGCSTLDYYNNIVFKVIKLPSWIDKIMMLQQASKGFSFLISGFILWMLVIMLFVVVYISQFGILFNKAWADGFLSTIMTKNTILFIISIVTIFMPIIPAYYTLYYLFIFPIQKSNLAKDTDNNTIDKIFRDNLSSIFVIFVIIATIICMSYNLNILMDITILGGFYVALIFKLLYSIRKTDTQIQPV